MKILFIIPYFYPAEFFGGPVKVTLDVAKELVRRGHHVVVYTSDAKDLTHRLISTVENIDGITVHYLKNFSMLPVKISKLFVTPQLPRKLRLEFASFDIVHLHEYATYQNIIACKLAKEYGIPYVIQTHGSLTKIGRPFRKWLFDLFFGNKLLKGSTGLLALNRFEACQYISMGVPAEKVTIIPNGLNCSPFFDLPLKGLFRKKYKLYDKKIVLYLGRLNKIKGIDVLVKAFADIAAKLQNVFLVIVGPDDGSLVEVNELIDNLKISDRVFVIGPLYDKEKLQAYVDADIYVLPSKYETFPMSLLEAYACSKPVIGSSIMGLNDLVIDGKTGLLFESGNWAQLSNSLLYLLTNEDVRVKLGSSAHQFAIENFNIQKIVLDLEKFYFKIIKKNAN